MLLDKDKNKSVQLIQLRSDHQQAKRTNNKAK